MEFLQGKYSVGIEKQKESDKCINKNKFFKDLEGFPWMCSQFSYRNFLPFVFLKGEKRFEHDQLSLFWKEDRNMWTWLEYF